MSLFINVVECFKKIRLRTNSDTTGIIKKKNIHLQLESIKIDKYYKQLNEFCDKIEIVFKKKKLTA